MAPVREVTGSSATTPGPGVRLLAELIGRSPEDVRRDPRALARAAAALGAEAIELSRSLRSEHPEVRAGAEARRRALLQRVEEGPSPARTLRDRIGGLLDRALEALS